MDGDSIGLIIVMVILLALSAFFSATETAFSTFNRIRMKGMAQSGNKRAALVMKYDDNYEKMLNSVLIGNNIINISLSSIATVFFVDIFSKMDPESAQSIGATVSTVVITIAVLIFCEISPNIIEFIPFQKTNFVWRSSCMIEFLFTIKNIIEVYILKIKHDILFLADKCLKILFFIFRIQIRPKQCF